MTEWEWQPGFEVIHLLLLSYWTFECGWKKDGSSCNVTVSCFYSAWEGAGDREGGRSRDTMFQCDYNPVLWFVQIHMGKLSGTHSPPPPPPPFWRKVMWQKPGYRDWAVHRWQPIFPGVAQPEEELAWPFYVTTYTLCLPLTTRVRKTLLCVHQVRNHFHEDVTEGQRWDEGHVKTWQVHGLSTNQHPVHVRWAKECTWGLPRVKISLFLRVMWH